MLRFHRLGAALLGVGLLGAALYAAVGRSPSARAAYPVEFPVQVKGKPAVGATVVLHPVGGANPNAPRPTGKVDDGGTVKLSTFAQDDGAPPGEYTVTVTWNELKTVIVGSDRVTELSPDKLKGKYTRPDAPTAPRVTVGKESNKLPAIQL